MGWYGEYCTRKQKVADLIGDRPSSRCIKHCYRGNAYRGVLWTVWQRGEDESSRWIGCDVLEYRDGMWFNKPMEEGMGPYYWSCPMGYLAITPVASASWREGVRAYHDRAKQRRLAKAS